MIYIPYFFEKLYLWAFNKKYSTVELLGAILIYYHLQYLFNINMQVVFGKVLVQTDLIFYFWASLPGWFPLISVYNYCFLDRISTFYPFINITWSLVKAWKYIMSHQAKKCMQKSYFCHLDLHWTVPLRPEL